MLIPVRCFSCGKPIGHLYEKFKKRSKKEDPAKVLDDLGVDRYCCRRMLISQEDYLGEIIAYKRY